MLWLKCSAVVLGLACATLLILSVINPHVIKGYYLGYQGGGQNPYCVYADVDWEPGYQVYCSSDLDSAGLMLMNMRHTQEATPQTIENKQDKSTF